MWSRQITLRTAVRAWWSARVYIAFAVLISVAAGFLIRAKETPRSQYKLFLGFPIEDFNEFTRYAYLSDYWCMGDARKVCKQSTYPFSPSYIFDVFLELANQRKFQSGFMSSYSRYLQVPAGVDPAHIQAAVQNFSKKVMLVRNEDHVEIYYTGPTDALNEKILLAFSVYLGKAHWAQLKESLYEHLARLRAVLRNRSEVLTPLILDPKLSRSESQYLDELIHSIAKTKLPEDLVLFRPSEKMSIDSLKYTSAATLLSFGALGFLLASIAALIFSVLKEPESARPPTAMVGRQPALSGTEI